MLFCINLKLLIFMLCIIGNKKSFFDINEFNKLLHIYAFCAFLNYYYRKQTFKFRKYKTTITHLNIIRIYI